MSSRFFPGSLKILTVASLLALEPASVLAEMSGRTSGSRSFSPLLPARSAGEPSKRHSMC